MPDGSDPPLLLSGDAIRAIHDLRSPLNQLRTELAGTQSGITIDGDTIPLGERDKRLRTNLSGAINVLGTLDQNIEVNPAAAADISSPETRAELLAAIAWLTPVAHDNTRIDVNLSEYHDAIQRGGISTQHATNTPAHGRGAQDGNLARFYSNGKIFGRIIPPLQTLAAELAAAEIRDESQSTLTNRMIGVPFASRAWKAGFLPPKATTAVPAPKFSPAVIEPAITEAPIAHLSTPDIEDAPTDEVAPKGENDADHEQPADANDTPTGTSIDTPLSSPDASPIIDQPEQRRPHPPRGARPAPNIAHVVGVGEVPPIPEHIARQREDEWIDATGNPLPFEEVLRRKLDTPEGFFGVEADAENPPITGMAALERCMEVAEYKGNHVSIALRRNVTWYNKKSKSIDDPFNQQDVAAIADVIKADFEKNVRETGLDRRQRIYDLYEIKNPEYWEEKCAGTDTIKPLLHGFYQLLSDFREGGLTYAQLGALLTPPVSEATVQNNLVTTRAPTATFIASFAEIIKREFKKGAEDGWLEPETFKPFDSDKLLAGILRLPEDFFLTRSLSGKQALEYCIDKSGMSKISISAAVGNRVTWLTHRLESKMLPWELIQVANIIKPTFIAHAIEDGIPLVEEKSNASTTENLLAGVIFDRLGGSFVLKRSCSSSEALTALQGQLDAVAISYERAPDEPHTVIFRGEENLRKAATAGAYFSGSHRFNQHRESLAQDAAPWREILYKICEIPEPQYWEIQYQDRDIKEFTHAFYEILAKNTGLTYASLAAKFTPPITETAIRNNISASYTSYGSMENFVENFSRAIKDDLQDAIKDGWLDPQSYIPKAPEMILSARLDLPNSFFDDRGITGMDALTYCIAQAKRTDASIGSALGKRRDWLAEARETGGPQPSDIVRIADSIKNDFVGMYQLSATGVTSDKLANITFRKWPKANTLTIDASQAFAAGIREKLDELGVTYTQDPDSTILRIIEPANIAKVLAASGRFTGSGEYLHAIGRH